MKSKLLILIFFVLTSVSCKKTTYQSMTVIKGCEGTYLRLNDKDHEICNEDLLDNYEDGTVVNANIERDDNCVSDRFHCAMLHNHECEPGTFKIIKIK